MIPRSFVLAALLLGACDGALATPHDGGVLRDSGFDPAQDASARDASAQSDATASIDSGTLDDAGLLPCEPVPVDAFGRIRHGSTPTDRPAALHGDINLALRGWSPTGGTLGLIEVDGPTDDRAPKLYTLFTDDRVPAFTTNYRMNHWDWSTNSRGATITDPEVTLGGFGTSPREVLELPVSGYEIAPGLQAMVLYADAETITLKYTAEDDVVYGYTIHLAGVCVDPRLITLYEELDAAGRAELPALAGGQPFARARGAEVRVAIRDTGSFMDPRVRKDWW